MCSSSVTSCGEYKIRQFFALQSDVGKQYSIASDVWFDNYYLVEVSGVQNRV